jgi:hypothetical protein
MDFNVFPSGAVADVDGSGSVAVAMPNRRRLAADCGSDGKWRVGDTVGTVPKGHDCAIEGFVVRGGRTARRGKVTHMPNGGGDLNHILRGNDVG